MKASDLHGSVWMSNEEEGNMVIRKQKGGYYGDNNEWDFERKTAKETIDQLKKWGYEHIGYDKV